MKALTVTSIISLGLVVGCGGGGGGEGGSGGSVAAETPPAVAPAPEPTPAPAPTPVSVARTMEDLSIPDSFDYQPIEEYSLTIDASSDVSGRAFVTVYTEFEELASGEVEPKYESKVASQALTSGKAKLSFNAAEHVGTFLVEIWTYDGNDPVKKQISATSSTLTW
ncbi:hypothetical protein [Vibrio maritimus]|uniref:hypothetical protein n=1 Tax=Vibrio maritimus TaxID=990268 RepID=UPI001F3011D8|nr:hypothetical protein [Vibrio maritimus]